MPFDCAQDDMPFDCAQDDTENEGVALGGMKEGPGVAAVRPMGA